jgi:FlaA1/EpsC-like NDP-sugar epimerase
MAGLVPDMDIPIVFTGLRPGEKLFEELLTEDEERTQKVTDKIFIAQSPPPPGDLRERIQEIVAAAQAENAARVVSLLEVLVPSYRPMSTEPVTGN